MGLAQLHIHNLRNISQAKIDLGNHFNVFYGANGSGKTSVLEAIYLLSSGKSFRTTQTIKIIQENKNKLTLFGKISDENFRLRTIGLEKSLSDNEIRIDGEKVKLFSELARCLPVLAVAQDSHKLLENGPQWRRQFLDWGLFHVKPEFLEVWSNYRKLLKNRNAALAKGGSAAEINAWDHGLAKYGEEYSQYREDYTEQLKPTFQQISEELLENSDVSLRYRKGWSTEKSLSETLTTNVERDRLKGRTEAGPHRADLIVQLNGREVRDHVSRGQQKLLVYALYLAQITHLQTLTGKKTLLLLDDIGAELDRKRVDSLLGMLSNRFNQVCLTTATLESLPLNTLNEVKLFHVKHGEIEAINNMSVGFNYG